MERKLENEYGQAEKYLRGKFNADFVSKLDKGDFAKNLLDYFRVRRKPRLLFTPDKFRENTRLAKKYDPCEAAWEKQTAEKTIRGVLLAFGDSQASEYFKVDREIFDFRFADSFDPEVLHGLCRMWYLPVIARCYWTDCDPKYFEAAMREWDFFSEKVSLSENMIIKINDLSRPVNPANSLVPYLSINMFLRLTNWYWAYWLLLHAKEMTPERNAVLLARCLAQFDMVGALGIGIQKHNFTAMEMESLYLWSSSLPEVTGMKVWRENARNNMDSSLLQALFEDGVHWEMSPDYHIYCISLYGMSYLLGLRNGVKWNKEYAQRLKKMGEYADSIITPDGYMPPISDSDRSKSWGIPISILKVIFPGMVFRRPVSPTLTSIWISDGLVWNPSGTVASKRLVSVFPDANIAVGRTSQESDAGMLYLVNGPTKSWHPHKCNMSVYYEAFGKAVLLDPGRWVYSGDIGRRWAISPQSHNTIMPEDDLIDSKYRGGYAFHVFETVEDNPCIGPVKAEAYRGFKRFETFFRGFVADADACVKRVAAFADSGENPWIVVADTISCPNEHRWTNSWLLPSKKQLKKTTGGYAAFLDNGLRVGISAIVPGEKFMLRDTAEFWSPVYSRKEPARWARFSSFCRQATRVFAFVPSSGSLEYPGISVYGGSVVLTARGEKFVIPLR
jgi:hypothetical protein